MKILEIKNIKKNYHSLNEVKAIEDFSLDVLKNDFIAIVGPSGCGKSTLLSILCGLEKETSGVVKYKENIKIGYMLQTDCLLEFKTVLENCLIGLDIKKIKTKENIEYVKSLINKYGLKDFINSYPKELSGGMRKRVALIRTLALKPDLLLLDEPFTGLDYQNRLLVSSDIYNILKKEKKSLIIVTHDIEEAISIGNKVILSKRPSKVKDIVEIKLDSTDPISNRKDKKFNYYYEKIWGAIDYE